MVSVDYLSESTITSNDSNTLVVGLQAFIYKVPKRASPTVTLYNSSDTTTASRVNAQGTERICIRYIRRAEC